MPDEAAPSAALPTAMRARSGRGAWLRRDRVASVRLWRGAALGFGLYGAIGGLAGMHDGGGTAVFALVALAALACAPRPDPRAVSNAARRGRGD